MTETAASRTDTGPIDAATFAELGEGRRELVRGEVIEMTPAGARHGDLAFRLGMLIGKHVEAHDLGRVYAAETGFLIERDPDTVRAPDIAFVTKDRVIETAGFFPQAPDLAVEVCSPGDRYGAVDDKVHQWLDAGTRQVWVVDPQAGRIQVFLGGGTVRDLGPGDRLEGGEVLPGFAVAVETVLRPDVSPG